MAVHVIDARGVKCIAPTLKLSTMSLRATKGDVLEVLADCETFVADVKEWCARNNRVLLWVREEGNFQKARIQF